jgi:hypothetical protein
MIISATMKMLGKGGNLPPAVMWCVIVAIYTSLRQKTLLPVVGVTSMGGEVNIQQRAIYDIQTQLERATCG